MRKFTRAEVKKRFPGDYELRSLDYGMQYYVAARFAAAAGYMPVSATLAHHALEAMLKAAASRGATKEQILQFKYRQNFGHDLGRLWAAFVKQHPGRKLHGFKTLIRELDKFERIRFAEQLMERQTMIRVDYVLSPKQPTQPQRMRRFTLRMDLLDKLVRLIFETMQVNASFYAFHYIGKHSARYYKLRNRHKFRT
jgi:hypothetical protein